MNATERASAVRALLSGIVEAAGGSLVQAHTPRGYTKQVWRDAVDDADDWASANATEFNNALRPSVRNALSANEKSLLLAYVCLKRAGLF